MLTFPLPTGHVYAPRTGDLRYHDGRGNLHEHRALASWQETYRERIKRVVDPTGRYDGPTQAAVVTLQQRTGLPATGLLDKATWEALWTVRPRNKPPKVVRRRPGGSPIRKLKTEGAKTYAYWQKYSRRGICYDNGPGAPTWWPGRPFGRYESGFHVAELQNLLGLRPTGVFNADTAHRVRGLQRLYKLPVSGVVDIRLANILDPPATAEAPQPS